MTSFAGLLFRWKASVYKIIFVELIVFIVAFLTINLSYKYGIKTRESKQIFEEFCHYALTYRTTLPISFILGFYVTVIYNRWWSQFNAIPRPDAIAVNVAAYVRGDDEESRLLRRTMVRYANLAATLTYCAISTSVKKRFPTQEHLIKSGLLFEAEKTMMNSVQSDHPKYWIPCVWFINLLRKADNENKISNAPGMKTLLDELNKFREKCDTLYSFDWIEVPTVYTQVVTLAVYSYFVASLFSHQFLSDESEHQYYFVDIYVPVTCLLELVFYIGWLKVAEKIMDPFGDDEHDFDMNIIVDRNLQVSYLTVDIMYDMSLTLEKDRYYQSATIKIPHTKASKNLAVSKGSHPWLGSANHVRLTDVDMETVGNRSDETACCSCFKKQNKFNTSMRESRKTNTIDHLPVIQEPKRIILNDIRPDSC